MPNPIENFSTWTKEEVFLTSRRFFDSMIDAIATAKVSVDLECYIFARDSLGIRVVEALKAASRRGVFVRVMVDDFGSPNWKVDFQGELAEAGVHSRIYNSIFSFRRWLRLLRLERGSLTSVLSRLNHRNHRKVCLVDGRTAFLGGMNIDISHSKWRDTGVLIEGVGVSSLIEAFEGAWHIALWGFKLKLRSLFSRKHPLVRLNFSRRRRRYLYKQLLLKVGEAKSRLWISTAYFIPPRRLTAALEQARKRGVDVKLLVPRKPDVFFVHWVSSIFYSSLLHAGVRVFEYLPHPMHSKTMLIDDWALVGSTNLNHRSLFHDLEVDVVLTNMTSVSVLQAAFESDLHQSSEVLLETWKKRPFFEKIFGRLLLALKYWM